MKKLFFILFAMVLTSSVIGQTVAAYAFTQSSGTFTPISGGTVLGSGTIDDNVYAANNIGFTFYFTGTAYTQFSVNANGWLCMGTSATSSYTPISTGTSNYVVSALGRDLQGLTNGELRYQVLGSSPNRTLVVQWLHYSKYGSTGTGDDWNFQIRLNETTNTIDLVYGSFIVNANTTTVEVGLRGASSADYKNRTTTTNWAATTAGGTNAANCSVTNTVYPASGLIFTFTGPPPPPSIVYTPLLNTSSTSARILTTTVSSPVGIPTSGIGLPRLYWRIGAGAWTGVTATWISGSTYNFSFGSPVVLGNVVQYYVVAQDLSATPILSAFPSAGAAGLTPNPPTAGTPPTTPSSYTIVPAFCGNKTIGTGGDYATLTAAATAINASEISCPVTLLLTATYNSAAETFPIVFQPNGGLSATNTLTIKPNTGVTATISGAAASGALIKILSNYTTIDGSNTTGGTSRNLTITNTSTTTPSVVLLGSTGTTPITGSTLKNSIVINGSNGSSAIVVSDGTTLGNAGYFDNIKIQNNDVRTAYIGIYATGGTTPQTGTNLSLIGNTLESTGANAIAYTGLYMQGVNGATVSGNSIGNFDATGYQDDRGIWLATGTINTVVDKNFIHDLTNTSGGGYGAYGVCVSTGQTPANITVANNSIYNIWGDGWNYTSIIGDNPFGIYAFSTQTGINIYFNSIYMYGDHLNSANALAAGICLGTGTVATIQNNMIVNNHGLVGAIGYGATGIYAQTSNAQFTGGGLDYNDYFINPASGIKSIGMIASTGYSTLATWQAASGQEANTQILDPVYTSATNLLPTNTALRLKGLYLAAVTTDITGAGRTNPADIGAYQFSPLHLVTTSAASPIGFTGVTLNGAITASNLTVTSGFEYGLTTAYGLTANGVPPTVTGNTNLPITAAITGLTMNTLYHFRAKGTSGSAVVYGSDMTFTTAGPPVITTLPATIVGASFATLNGSVNPNNDNTTVSFEYGLTIAYGTPVTVAGTYSGSSVQNFSATISGLTINQTYHYRAKGINGGGTIYGADQTFFTTCVVPPVPGVITGPASVCKGGSGYVYSVSQVPYGFVYNWTFPSGFTITTYPNSNSVTVSVSNAAVSGNISVIAVSDCGANSPASSKAVTVNNLPVPTVSGNSPVCQFANNNYSTQAGNSSYIWTVSPDGVITPTSNPEVVTVNWTATGSKTVGVIYTSPATGCAAAAPGTLPVTVNAAPVPTITGVNNMCANSGYYYYSTETGKTNYSWTISPGGTITFGQGSAQIEVVWNTPGAQFVTVNYSNATNCSAASPTTYNVTVAGLPGAAGAISGSSDVCFNSTGVAYSVAPITNATAYVWSLPAGATIVSGDGTNSINVNFAASTPSGNITVYGNSLCGNGAISPPFPVTVNQLPGAAGTITGSSSVCAGETGVAYSVPAITGATGYTWTLPAGASVASGGNTQSITVDFANDAVSGGNIVVYGTNSCGNGTSSTSFTVTVYPKPVPSVITLSGDVLSSNVADGNQWYYNGAMITGATEQNFQALYDGWYWDVITKNGCVSDTSNNIYVTITGIEDPATANFLITPVPNNGYFKATINSPVEQRFTITIVNSLGVTIYESKDNNVKGSFEKNIDLRPISSGVYSVIFQSVDKRTVKKIIINK